MQPEVMAFFAGMILVVIKAIQLWIVDNFTNKEE